MAKQRKNRTNLRHVDHDAMVRRLVDVWQAASPADHLTGSTWYPAERDFVLGIASRTGLRPDTLCAVHAILSPRVSTVLNRALTESMVSTHYAPTFDRSVAKCRAILDSDSPHVGYSFPNTIGDIVDYPTSCNGPKVSRFFLTILSGGASDIAVVDRHMVDILTGVRRISDSVNLDTEKQYHPYELAILDAAQSIGVPTHVLQATTWISWRRVHGIVDSYTEMEDF